jgi:hypothetical protein
MAITAKLDELGMGAWIALMIVSFIFWWPLGLATLAFLIGSGRMGRMGCWKQGDVGRWHGAERVKEGAQWWRQPPSSGNHAFDEYRTETLRRLEEEQREFREFLDRLRFARDKTEFDQFMSQAPRASSVSAPYAAELTPRTCARCSRPLVRSGRLYV